MAEGRRRDAWDRTSHVLAMIYNAFRGRGPALGADEFHPLRRLERPPATLRDLAALGLLAGATQSHVPSASP